MLIGCKMGIEILVFSIKWQLLVKSVTRLLVWKEWMANGLVTILICFSSRLITSLLFLPLFMSGRMKEFLVWLRTGDNINE